MSAEEFKPRARKSSGTRLLLVLCVSCALSGSAMATDEPCPSADILSNLHGESVPLRFSEQPWLRAPAERLDKIATSFMADAEPFAFEIHFNPLYVPTMQQPPNFWLEGQFASPCDQTRYMGLQWGYGDWTNVYAGNEPYRQRAGYSEDLHYFSEPPQPEPNEDHLRLHGWVIDFPQVNRLLETHADLFSAGLELIEVTTAGRYRYEETSQHVAGSLFFFREPVGVRKTLDGIEASRTVMELLEGTRPTRKKPCVGGSGGHYLIADAATGGVLESGSFMRCRLVEAQSCTDDRDCPGSSRCVNRSFCGRTNMWCDSDAECKYSEFCDYSQPDRNLSRGKCAPRGGHYPDENP
jgi:hypothetical protein